MGILCKDKWGFGRGLSAVQWQPVALIPHYGKSSTLKIEVAFSAVTFIIIY